MRLVDPAFLLFLSAAALLGAGGGHSPLQHPPLRVPAITWRDLARTIVCSESDPLAAECLWPQAE